MQNPNVIRTRSRQKVAVPARDIPWTFMFWVVLCACVVATGFFFAARQHFTSMDYGIKNSRLREQLRNLEAENRRLILAREIALSPISIRKAAREVGLHDVKEEVVPVQISTGTETRPETNPTTSGVTAAKAVKKQTEAPPVVVPASSSAPTAPVRSNGTGETRRRIVEPQKEKKDKVEVAALLNLR